MVSLKRNNQKTHCLELPCYKKPLPKPRILLQNGFGLKWKRVSFATSHRGDFQILVFLPSLFSREIKQTAFYKEKLFLVTYTFPALSKAFLLIIFRVQRKRRKRKKRKLMRTNGRNHSFKEFIIESPGYIMLTIQSEMYVRYSCKIIDGRFGEKERLIINSISYLFVS